MGYETKMYLVEKSEVSTNDNGASYCQVIAMVDLCKMGYHGQLAKIDEQRPEKPEVYFYDVDGNTEVTVDCYDKPLGVYDPQIVLNAMKADNDEEYRRFDIGIALLESAIPRFQRLKILFYGH